MTYDRQIFISYAHLDNQPLTPEEREGWVSRFHEALQTILTMRMGRKAQIWRDKKLCGNDIFADEILDQFPKTEILISVVSKCYVGSEWCRREIQEFCQRCGQLRVGNKYRVMKVIKLPTDSDDPLPAFMKEMDGYEFYAYQDPEQGKIPLELDPRYFPELKALYYKKLCALAEDVIDLIKRLEGQASSSVEILEQPHSCFPVFLAQSSRDQREAREALAMDLREHRYPLLPNRQLPNEEADFVEEVNRSLDQCVLSVHMVGGYSGFVLDGPSRKSAVVLQNELAIAQAKKKGIRRLIWLPEGTISMDREQAQFIQKLHRDAEAQFGADLITGDLQLLKDEVHKVLEDIESDREGTKRSTAENPRLIYLICDQKDRETVLPLRKSLKNCGFEVKIPIFDGDAGTVDRANQEAMASCRAALIFYGRGDEGWKRTVDSELIKSKAYRRKGYQMPQFTYLSTPVTPEKTEMIELEEPNLISGLNGSENDGINSLLEMLRMKLSQAA